MQHRFDLHLYQTRVLWFRVEDSSQHRLRELGLLPESRRYVGIPERSSTAPGLPECLRRVLPEDLQNLQRQ